MTVRAGAAAPPVRATSLSGRFGVAARNGLGQASRIAFAVLDLTGSASDLGLVLAARSVPLVVFVLFGGVLADRLPRHLVLVVTNLVSGGTQALAAASAAHRPRDRSAAGRARGRQRRVVGVHLARDAPGCCRRPCRRTVLQPANVVLRLATPPPWSAARQSAASLVAAVGPGWGLAVDAVTFSSRPPASPLIRLPCGRPDAGEQRARGAARGLDRVPVPHLALGRRPGVRA